MGITSRIFKYILILKETISGFWKHLSTQHTQCVLNHLPLTANMPIFRLYQKFLRVKLGLESLP